MTATERLLDQASADLGAGRPWLARDRLENALVFDSSLDDVRALLAEAFLRMGDERRAGRVLASTERVDDEAVAAIAVWIESLGDQSRLTRRAVRDVLGTGVVAEERLESLGPVARARLDPIVVAVRAEVDRLQAVGKRLDGIMEPDGTLIDRPPIKPAEEEFGFRAKLGIWIAAGLIVAGLFQVGGWVGLW